LAIGSRTWPPNSTPKLFGGLFHAARTTSRVSLKDWKISIKVFDEYVKAMQTGNKAKIVKVRKRLDKILGPSLT